ACNNQNESSTNDIPNTSADLIITNAKIYTVNPNQEWASAVAISDGKIIYVGDEAGSQAFLGDNTKTSDLRGQMVLPSFHDVHVHPVHSGVTYQQCSLFDIKGADQLIAKVKQCAENNPDKPWIIGGGWTVDNFAPSGLPDKKLLDAVVSDRPVSLKSSDGHSLWVNSKALELAGIDNNTPDPEGGRIDRYPSSKEPSGSFQENAAMMLVMAKEPQLTPADLVNGLEYARDLFHSMGITGLQDALLKLEPGDPYYGLDAYNTLEQKGELNLHVVNAMYWQNELPLDFQLKRFIETRNKQPKGNIYNTSIKIWQDGVIETHTAALIEPYSDRDDNYKGDLLNTPESLNKAVAALDAEGFQIHFHAIGDQAIRTAFDSLEHARDVNGVRDSRHHMSHIEQFNPADIPRFKELDVVANFQPFWAIEDAYITELTWPKLGKERSKWLYPMGSVQRSGAKIAFGSDWYVSSVNPLDGIEVAVTRLEPSGATKNPLGENEEMSLAQAIQSYTINAAYVNHLDDKVGSVEVGKLADLIVLDKNLFNIPAKEINETKVTATLFGGKLVYGEL
ncbi:MAG: amidohydrolase family protein, partial [Gammaproteobacteria bacterium]|nr:amidohydrolase family protein [Gammaproteobacteria bacterium]